MTKLVLAALAALLLAAPASGEGVNWHAVPIEGGCVVVVGEDFRAGEIARWSQPCTPGQVVNGRGSFTLLQPSGFSVSMTGEFVAGVPHGAQTTEVFTAAGVSLGSMTAAFNMGCPPAEEAARCVPYVPPR